MPTIQDMLAQDFFGEEKVASDNSASNEIDELARTLGLDGFDKVAEDDEGEDEGEGEGEYEGDDEDEGEEKEASFGLGDLYNDLFPEDAAPQEKTASEKVAAYQSAVGERAFSHYANRFDQRIEKLAAATLSGGATISSPTDDDGKGNPHEASIPPQAMDSNYAEDADEGIDTDPEYTDEVSKGDDERVVGHYEQKTAALRKHLLLSRLER